MKPPSVTACRCAKSITGRTQPSARGDREDVLGGAELAHAAHHLDPERHRAALALESLAQHAELLDDRVERVRALAAEQEARVEDDELGAGRRRDPGRVVEHPDRHPELLVALDVAHEAGDRRVHREHDARLAGELAEALGPRVVHPEPALEVDLAGAVAALEQQLDRRLRALARRNARRAESKLSHPASVSGAGTPSDALPTLFRMAKRPSRIDLLELDIDLRLADLWREAAEIDEWSLDVVAAFMRAAYGKGYCDALTEERRARSARTTATGSRRAARATAPEH